MTVDEYILDRGYLESSRLNLQIYLWHDAIGYSLHPSIQTAAHRSSSSSNHFRIADIATGTGLWLSTIAQKLPTSVQLDGFDISGEQFASVHSLPDNVRLRQLDAMAPPPPDLVGHYDAVHIRLLIGVVNGDDPTAVLKHARSLLKPGGLLQWDEMDPAALVRIPTVASDAKRVDAEADMVGDVDSYDHNASPCLDRLVDIFNTAKKVSWVARLPQIAMECGFDVLENEEHHEKVWQRQAMMDIWCLVTDAFAAGLTGDRASELRAVTSGASREARRGQYYSQTFRVLIARLAIEQ